MSAPALPVADVRLRPVKTAAAASEVDIVWTAVRALASLKLTVALFALGIFIVYVGTTAQQEADIWQVVRDYFHAWLMWVDVNLLFPKAFFPFVPHLSVPPFPFPGGCTIGVLMAINLLAAHGLRFTIQARGMRLVLGIVVMLVGIAVGVVIIWAGHNSSGFQAKPPFTWDTFWAFFLTGSALLWCVAAVAYGYFGVWGLLQRFRWPLVPLVQFVWLLLIGLPLLSLGGTIAWAMSIDTRPSGEALRVVWQLIQGGLAGLILLVGCIMIFRKRGGMVLLHLGIGLLMFNELWVAMTARERQVFMQEEQTVNYFRDIRTVELAIVDRSAQETDDHVVIPRDLLVENYEANRSRKADDPAKLIEHLQLPVKVAVLEYFKHALVEDLKPGDKPRATTGRGLQETLVQRRAAKGTDTGGMVDIAGAYVQFFDKQTGRDLGTYMLSQLVDFEKRPDRFAEKLTVGDTTYDVYLRFKREYKPFTLRLVDVRKDDYVASNTPRNYSSDVRVIDPESGLEEAVHIKMNDPLRYRGDTFYQSNYHPPETPGGKEATTLQVVRNRGWMIPYVSCMVVVIGMVAHFLLSVTRFVSRREAEELAAGDVLVAELAGGPSGGQSRGKAKRTARRAGSGGIAWSKLSLPLLAIGVIGLWLSSGLHVPQPAPTEMDIARFGQLPIAHDGRVKPIDTLARNMLRALSLYETVKTADGKRISATQWLLDVVTGVRGGDDEPIADKYRVFRIDHPDLLKLLKLDPRRKGYRYSIAEIREHMDELLPLVQAAHKVERDDRTVEQRRVVELEERLRMYMLLRESFAVPRDLPRVPEERAENPQAMMEVVGRIVAAIRESALGLREVHAPQPIPVAASKQPSEEAELLRRLMRNSGVPLAGSDPQKPDDGWELYSTAIGIAYLERNLFARQSTSPVVMFEEIKSAYQEKDAAAFNRRVREYESHLAQSPPPLWNPRKIDWEAYRNAVSPYYLAMQIYVLAFLAAICGWLFRSRQLNWAAFTIVLLTFVFHTAALCLNIYISGRPPVTNLHSSAVFIGWAAVFFGLVIEAIFRLGLGNIVASVAGFATLIIAYFLSAGGDTITVLQAVLDTQFWLALHVTCVTLGYASTYFAGLFGLLYVLFGLATPLVDRGMRKEIGRIIYGITCFAILFSFFGTVLGGLWADDSWGRFWGWDPKENGALIIVLWNALILHARWDKMIADRGLAVLAIGGNIVTSWSWFGVNQLGIGLHSYGFTNGVAVALVLFGLTQLVLIGLGCLPTRMWWSYQADHEPMSKPASE